MLDDKEDFICFTARASGDLKTFYLSYKPGSYALFFLAALDFYF